MQLKDIFSKKKVEIKIKGIDYYGVSFEVFIYDKENSEHLIFLVPKWELYNFAKSLIEINDNSKNIEFSADDEEFGEIWSYFSISIKKIKNISASYVQLEYSYIRDKEIEQLINFFKSEEYDNILFDYPICKKECFYTSIENLQNFAKEILFEMDKLS